MDLTSSTTQELVIGEIGRPAPLSSSSSSMGSISTEIELIFRFRGAAAEMDTPFSGCIETFSDRSRLEFESHGMSGNVNLISCAADDSGMGVSWCSGDLV